MHGVLVDVLAGCYQTKLLDYGGWSCAVIEPIVSTLEL
jgi:hypothetical protein